MPTIPDALPNAAPLLGARFNSDWRPLILSALAAYERNYLYDVSDAELIEIMAKIEGIQQVFMEAKPVTISGLPFGTIVPNVGYLHDPDDESGMLSCDGTTYNKTDYPDLWQYFADAVANGAAWVMDTTTFDVPNLNDPKRFIRGAITAFGIISEAGLTDGADTHTLTESEMPAHTHNFVTRNNGTIGATAPLGGTGGSLSNARETEAAGGGNAHNNVPASMRIPYYIAAR